MRTPLRLTAAILGAVLLAACGGTPTEPTSPGASEPATDDQDTEEPTDDGSALADGEHFGFVRGVDADAATVDFDPATWVADDDEPNGYRIDDPDAATVTLPVASDATIEVLTATGDPSTATEVDVTGLAAWADGPASGQDLAFDVVVDGGVVTTMTFVYRP